ncbi:MAG: type I DNA topoisomerase [Candidatus Caldatribacteriota bacterium]|nr:type I DNA topoisomerase [Candidatus Caldatribacteriota bacterium]
MSKFLVIVESPTKEKTLKKILGKNYLIKSSKGHLIDLPKTKLGIDVKDNFKPKYVVVPKQRITLKELEKSIKGKEKVFLATDPDREGEAIAWHIAQKLNIKDLNSRVSFNEITEKAVLKAVSAPREIDLNMVNSQKTRRLLDRLVGYKISPLLWKKIKGGLSAGRVQSAALKIICDKEEEIGKFNKEEYWLITVLFKESENKKAKPFEAKLVSVKAKKVKLENEKDAEKVVEEVKKGDAQVKKVDIKEELKKPPFPFVTSSLQQEAFSKLNFSIKKTMHVAQKLYEGINLGKKGTTGLITYMRTDSIRISDEAKIDANKYIKKYFGEEYIKPFGRSKKKVKKTKNNKIQDAHEAIRPTSVNNDPGSISEYLDRDQYRLYKLIWNKFVASRMNEARLKKMSIDIEIGKYIFKTTGSEVLFDGFLRIYSQSNISNIDFPPLKKGDKLDLADIKKEQFFTKPPLRYSEASLVKRMEKEGIGRPSTYVPIIDTIQRRKYVEKIKKKFFPTDMGKKVNSFLNNYFSNIMDIYFTAKMEKQLDEIEVKGKEWVEVLRKFYLSLSKDLEKANNAQKLKLEPVYSEEICEKCGKQMLIKHGRFGKFLACSGFPECKNTKPFLDKIGVSCPKKDCNGEIIKRKTKKGRIFYGCSNYPECSFMSWKKPVNKKCPECHSILFITQDKKNGNYYECSSSECNYKELLEKKEDE